MFFVVRRIYYTNLEKYGQNSYRHFLAGSGRAISPQELLLKFDRWSCFPRAQLLRNGWLVVVASLEEGQLRHGAVIDEVVTVSIYLGFLCVVQVSVWRKVLFGGVRGVDRVMVIAVIGCARLHLLR